MPADQAKGTAPGVPLIEVRNLVYNPMWSGGLTAICNAQAEERFALLRVVPVGQYEAVAVFLRPELGDTNAG